MTGVMVVVRTEQIVVLYMCYYLGFCLQLEYVLCTKNSYCLPMILLVCKTIVVKKGMCIYTFILFEDFFFVIAILNLKRSYHGGLNPRPLVSDSYRKVR